MFKRIACAWSEDYPVEQVTAENSRGWQRPDGRVEVSLLNLVDGRQRVLLHLARRRAVGEGSQLGVEVSVIEVRNTECTRCESQFAEVLCLS